MTNTKNSRFAGIGVTHCYSFSDECWHAYYWIDFGFFGEFRRLGPSFPDKGAVLSFVAAAKRGDFFAGRCATLRQRGDEK